MVVRMNRRLAAERCASELAASVCDDLVDVHVELRSAAGHPDVERKHLMVRAGKKLVANARDQFVGLVAEPTSGVVCGCRRPLQDGIGGDHLARNQIMPDAEMPERPLGLWTPQLVRRNLDPAPAV